MSGSRIRFLALTLAVVFTQGMFGNHGLASPPPAPAGRPADVPADWWGAVQKDLAASEYRVTWQDHTPLGGCKAAYHAPNRAQNLRTYFTSTGFRTIPRTARKDESPAWEWGLSFVRVSRIGWQGPAEGEAVANPADIPTAWLRQTVPPVLCVDGNRVEYDHGDVIEWYVNDERGLEQGFTILRKPSAVSDQLSVNQRERSADTLPQSALRNPKSEVRLVLSVTGNVTASVSSNGQSVDFLAPGGARAVNFAGLKAFDATGRSVPTRFEASSQWPAVSDQDHAVNPQSAIRDPQSICIVVNDTDAVYPLTIDPLATSPGWMAESDQASAFFGNSVATAGDVNGDGYSDVIVGARLYDNGQTNEGRAYLYLGSASGLSATASWTAESDQASANFGVSVSTAGDVNGDGYSDVIVGANLYDNGESNEGRAYVYLGSATGLSATPAWVEESDQTSALFGNSVAAAGDVNDDGFSDVIVGANQYDNGQTDEGRAFVYYGSASGLGAAPNWTAESDQASAQFGFSVATAGDVNGDGYSDVIIGAVIYDNGQNNEGRAYVYHGSAAGLSATSNWNAESDQISAELGYSVSPAGDVNGDGYSDVIVGAWAYDNGQTDEGRAYVYHGSAAGLSATPNWTFECDQADANSSYSVATAGDVNGDGYCDVIVGAPNFDNDQIDEGRTFLFHGSSTGLSTTPNWTAEGDQAGASFHVVATAGDINGDGYSDLIVGAPTFDNGQTNEGRAFVYVGAATALSAEAGWAAEGGQDSALLGSSISTAGDVDGDGYGDVIVGAPNYDNGESNEGRAYLYHGSAAGLSATAAWTAESNQVNALFGWSVSTAGDVNGDGFSDVIVGARYYDNGQTDEGRAFVWHGSASGLGADGTPLNADWTAESDQLDARFGDSVATAGDVNGDGFSDVIVGAPYYDNVQTDEGRAFVYYGSAAGLAATAVWTAEGDQAFSGFAGSVSTAGDVNGDGYSDVIVGALGYDNVGTDSGRAFAYYGSPAGLAPTSAWMKTGDSAGGLFGISVSTAGDVNGDGYSDVIVGAHRYNNGQTGEGGAFAFYGSVAGLSLTANWTAESDQAEALFGFSVSTAGDVNGDGYSDVIVGAPLFDTALDAEGRAYVYRGSAAGLSISPAWTAEIDVYTAHFGSCVATAGDVNGDGYGDVIVGAEYYGNFQYHEGGAFVYYGNGGPGRGTLPRQQTTTSVNIPPLGLSDSPTTFRLRYIFLSIFGRTRMRSEYEAKRFGIPFDGSGLVAGSLFDIGPNGQEPYTRLIGGLSAGNQYHWRVRTRYDMTKTPFQRHGPWIHIPTNGWNEADLRTFCAAPLGDMNCNCAFDLNDVPAFVQALLDPSGYAAAYPGCSPLRGDMQPDFKLDGQDVQRFVDLLVP